MWSTARLVWKQHRFELVAIVGALLVLTILTLDLWAQLRSLEPTPECLVRHAEGESIPECRVHPWLTLLNARAADLMGPTTFLPLIGGAVLGSLLVAREIEHRTAQIAWSLGPSRGRWLAERVLPVLVPLVIALVGLAVASELAVGAKGPDVDPRQSFQDYGSRGLPLVMRGVAAFVLALLAGALLGRQIPALLTGTAIILLIQAGLGLTFPYGVEPEWVLESEMLVDERYGYPDRYFAYGFVMPDGHIASWREAQVAAPPDAPYPGAWVSANLAPISLMLTGSHLAEIEARESLLLGLMVVAGLAGTALVVASRRPY